jgi:hypothetical protein
MNNRLNALCLGGAMALSFLMTKPAVADEWNNRTEFQFRVPVEIPGKVLTPGEYVFELANRQTDRNIVQVFSEDSNGHESLVATFFAIPDYISKTPDEPVIRFEERHSSTPELIQSWFYPGENMGWEFVYPRGQSLEASENTTLAPAPVASAAAPSLPPPPQVQEEGRAIELAAVEGEVLVAQNSAPAPPPVQEAQPPAQETDTQISADRMLPETGGYSGLELIAGLTMLGAGIATVFASRCKTHA